MGKKKNEWIAEKDRAGTLTGAVLRSKHLLREQG